MGRKSILKPFKMLDSADISINQTSAETNVEPLDKAAIQVEWAGTSPVGVLEVYAKVGSETDWQLVDMGDVINITGNTGDHWLIFTELPFTKIKLEYVASSGTGSLTATLTGKVVGA